MPLKLFDEYTGGQFDAPIEPPVEGWHEPCTVQSHKWAIELDEGIARLVCADRCPDPNVYDPAGITPACLMSDYWVREDLQTEGSIPVEITLVDDSTPSTPDGPAEYGFWIDVKRPKGITVDQDFAFRLLDLLRLTPIYSLMGSRFEESELPEDFKPHKWEGFELEHAEGALEAYRTLLKVMEGQIG